MLKMFTARFKKVSLWKRRLFKF